MRAIETTVPLPLDKAEAADRLQAALSAVTLAS